MRCRSLGVSVAALLIAASGARGADPGGDQWTPGYHESLPLPGRSTDTYDIYLPKSYPGDGTKRYPVVFMSGPVGRAATWSRNQQMPEWADGADAILIGVNVRFFADGINPQTGRPVTTEGAVALEPYMRLADQVPHAHPGLRFGFDINTSGGDKWWTAALRYRDRMAGFIRYRELVRRYPGTHAASVAAPRVPA